MPSVLQAASSAGQAAKRLRRPERRPGQGQLAVYSEVPSDSLLRQRLVQQLSARGSCSHRDIQTCTRAAASIKPNHSRMTKTQFLTPALSRRTAGIAPARFVDTRGPLVPAARAGHAALPMGRAAQATDTLRSLKCAAAGLVDAAL